MRICRFAIDHRAAGGAGALAIIALFAWGARTVEVETTHLTYFPKDDPVRRSVEAVNEQLGLGDAAFFVAIDGPQPDSITQLSPLHRIAALQDYIERIPQVKSTSSIFDYVKLLHRTLHDNDPAYYGLPDTDAAVSQYMLLLDAETLGDVLSGELLLPAAGVPVHAAVRSLAGSRDKDRSAGGADVRDPSVGCEFIRRADEERTALELFLYGSDLQWHFNGMAERVPTPLERVRRPLGAGRVKHQSVTA